MNPRRLVMAVIIGASASSQTACAPAMPSTQSQSNLRPAKWPLKFKEHTFRFVCYSTQVCEVWYAGVWSGRDKPQPPSSEYGPKYLDHILGGHVGIANFPEPAKVSWRSLDGIEHQAQIDFGAIFSDRLIRHNVPREEVADLRNGELGGDPLILLEVNDRTIRVYMRVSVPTKHFRIPENPLSDYRNDLILAKTYHY